MAACVNHALWIESLNRIDRINRQHATDRQPYKKAEWTRRQLQQPVKTRLQPIELRGPLCSPYSQMPTTNQKFDICPICKGKRTFFCYVACKCGVTSATALHTTANKMGVQPTGQAGDAGSKNPCPIFCSCEKCPEECHPACVCGCRDNGCCTHWKKLQNLECQNCCHCNCNYKQRTGT